MVVALTAEFVAFQKQLPKRWQRYRALGNDLRLTRNPRDNREFCRHGFVVTVVGVVTVPLGQQFQRAVSVWAAPESVLANWGGSVLV